MRRGFTLVEILVVIVIIAILTALLIGGISAALAAGKRRATRGFLATLEGALMEYKNTYQDFPPTLPEELGPDVRGMNATNNGAEALVACLSTQDRGGPFLQVSDVERAFGNFDGDSSARVKARTNFWFGDEQLREPLDYYGQPILYMHRRDYAKEDERYGRYLTGAGEQVWRPAALESTGSFPNPQTYILLSPGGDGRFGTDDDVSNYE